MKKLFTLTTALLASFSLWAADVKPSIDGVTDSNTPAVPSAALDLASQEDYTPDANGWIVSYTKGVVESKSWWSKTQTNGGSTTWTVPEGTTAPFQGGSSKNRFTMSTSRVHALRFTSAEKAAFLVRATSSGGTYRNVKVNLYSFKNNTLTLIETLTTGSTDTNVKELLFDDLTKSTDYVAYIYGDNSSNADFFEFALKAAPSTPSITAFSVAGVDATIDQDLKTITATVPNDTEGWPNLTPSVTIGGSATGYTPTGAQDFSAGAINYTVTDGTNNVIYAVTITRAEACENPEITTDLSTDEVIYLKNAIASPLTISATGKNLTYQWYSNTTNSTDGATSLGTSAQTDSYTPSTTDLGTVYYFCVVSSGICTTTSAITPITVKMPRTTGWVIYDGMTDESFTSGSIEYNSVTVNYTVVGNSMLSASDLANRNKNNDFNDYTYPNAVKIEKHNPEAETPVNAYVSFTIPSGYQATKIILAVGVAGGGRDIVLAKSAVTTVESTDVITHFEQGGKSDRIYDVTYTPASAIAAGTYYILTPVGGTWNIFHLQLLLEPASATALDNTEVGAKAVKSLKNGVLIIEKNGKKYNIIGLEIR